MFCKTVILALCFFLLAQQALANDLMRDGLKREREEGVAIERKARGAVFTTIKGIVCGLPIIGGMSAGMCPTTAPPPAESGSLGSITDLVTKLTGSLTGSGGSGSGSGSDESSDAS